MGAEYLNRVLFSRGIKMVVLIPSLCFFRARFMRANNFFRGCRFVQGAFKGTGAQPVILLACISSLFLFAPKGAAQESIRPSLTGASASTLRQASTQGDYNLKLGPVLVDLSSSVEIEGNDNINIAETGRKADLIIRPSIDAHTTWQITRVNALHLDIGLAYAKYLNNSSVDTKNILIAPNSQLAFDIFIGDFKINIHDQFAILQNPIDDISVSNVAKFDRFQNSAGFSVLWDLNDIKLVFGYDHFNWRAMSSQFSYLNRSEDQFYGSASADLDSTLRVGLDASVTPVSYTQDFQNSGVMYSGGPFVEKQISNYLKLRLSGGYQGASFDSGGANLDNSDQNSFYADLSLNHRMNAYWTESLSVGHETRLSLETNYVAYTYVRYMASWQVNRKITLSMNGYFEDADESPSALQSEHAKRFGVGLATSYRINRKLSLGLRYGYVKKDSDLDQRSYYQNSGAVSLTYDF